MTKRGLLQTILGALASLMLLARVDLGRDSRPGFPFADDGHFPPLR